MGCSVRWLYVPNLPTDRKVPCEYIAANDLAFSQLASTRLSRVSEVLRGKKGLSMAMVQRLRARFRVPVDLA